MTQLARLVARRRWYVIGTWIALTIFGAFSAGQLADRWFQEFSIPGYPAYEANIRSLEALGNGRITPYVAVLEADSDITKIEGVDEAFFHSTPPGGARLSRALASARTTERRWDQLRAGSSGCPDNQLLSHPSLSSTSTIP